MPAFFCPETDSGRESGVKTQKLVIFILFLEGGEKIMSMENRLGYPEIWYHHNTDGAIDTAIDAMQKRKNEWINNAYVLGLSPDALKAFDPDIEKEIARKANAEHDAAHKANEGPTEKVDNLNKLLEKAREYDTDAVMLARQYIVAEIDQILKEELESQKLIEKTNSWLMRWGLGGYHSFPSRYYLQKTVRELTWRGLFDKPKEAKESKRGGLGERLTDFVGKIFGE